MRLNAFMKNINVLNLILITAGFLFFNYTLLPLSNVSTKIHPPTIAKLGQNDKGQQAEEPKILSPFEYTVIADQNLFHSERRIPPEKKEEKALPIPEFVLYGTLISDGMKLAYLEDQKAPVNSPGRGKRQTVLKVGEIMSGFKLNEVDPDKVVLSRGEQSLTVYVMDPNAAKDRGAKAAVAGAQPTAVSKKSVAARGQNRRAARGAAKPSGAPPQAGKPAVNQDDAQ
ncbi:MAG: hypothetical protein ACLPX5_13970 [Dissulfurispiraceae bacterium]